MAIYSLEYIWENRCVFYHIGLYHCTKKSFPYHSIKKEVVEDGPANGNTGKVSIRNFLNFIVYLNCF